MNLDVSKIVSELGADLVAKIGEPLGLDADQSQRVAQALAANFSKGQDEAVKAAVADTGLTEEVVASMAGKLIEEGKSKLLEQSGMTEAVDAAKEQAAAALQNAGGEAMKKAGGFLSGLFGRK